MSFRVYRLAKKEQVQRRFREWLCVNNNCTGGQQVCIDEDGRPNRLERAQEFEKSFLIGGLELFEFVGDVLGFAAMAEDGVEKSVGSAIVHETRMQADTPERGGADFIGGIVVFGDGEVSPVDLVHLLAIVLQHGHDEAVARAHVVEKEITVGMNLLLAERGINGQGPTIDLCSCWRGGQCLD